MQRTTNAPQQSAYDCGYRDAQEWAPCAPGRFKTPMSRNAYRRGYNDGAYRTAAARLAELTEAVR